MARKIDYDRGYLEGLAWAKEEMNTLSHAMMENFVEGIQRGYVGEGSASAVLVLDFIMGKIDDRREDFE